MSFDFQTTIHGKWILAGEHAVIRGHAALIFPLSDKILQLSYQALPYQHPLKLQVDVVDQQPAEMQDLLQQIIEHGMKLIGRHSNSLQGELHIKSNIPIGVGMGASAALCVALARWFAHQQWVDAKENDALAQSLEHFFHGQSSGLDIAGVSSDQGLYFQQGISQAVRASWSPNWQLSSCGQQGPTANCIRKVQQLWADDPTAASTLDLQMQESVLLAKKALETAEPLHQRQDQLVKAIEKARNCFERWGLITDSLQQHIQSLYDKGALAVKPTGSGGGGMVISLWA